jgi:ABC-type xylose transport system permease subunit
MILFVGMFIFIQTKTVLGKYTYAIGGNKLTATLSGINANAIIFFLYIVVGILAAFSGTLLASRMGVGTPTVGIGFEFDVIVAVLLGGTSLSGGEGSIIGMVIGAFIVGFLGNGLNLLNVHTFYQSILKGIVLVVAVILDITFKEKIK